MGKAFRDLEHAYGQYRIAIRIAAEVMKHGNASQQLVYADTAEPDCWGDALVTLWVGEEQKVPTPRVQVTTESWNRMIHVPDSIYAPTPRWPELEDWVRGGCPFSSLSNWCKHSGPQLSRHRLPDRRVRFGLWCWLYEASIALLDRLPGSKQWLFSTGFHGGWGTYYLNFRGVDDTEDLYRISEKGHLAGDGDHQAVEGFSWMDIARKSASPAELVDPLLAAVRAFARL